MNIELPLEVNHGKEAELKIGFVCAKLDKELKNQSLLNENSDVSAWSYVDMSGLNIDMDTGSTLC